MNWGMIGAIGEIAGAVAVFVSLLYLAKQIRMSNWLAQAEAWRAPISDLNNLNAAFCTNPKFAEALFRVLDGALAEDLDEADAASMTVYLISIANIYEQLFREVRDGVLDERALSEFVGRNVPDIPFFREGWEGTRRHLGPPFVECVEKKHGLAAPD